MSETIQEATAISPLRARLRKRHRHLVRWAARENLTAYRLFDRDLLDYHFTVDRYDHCAVVAEYPWKAEDQRHERRREELFAALTSECGIQESDIFLKTHRPQGVDEAQYGRAGASRKLVVREGGLRFQVDLGPYLDVGLFLDHRVTRRWISKRSAGKRVLNLFSYTGAFTVAAAVGGASRTVSVDLSRTYNAWARQNLDLNEASGPRHSFVDGDARAFIRDGAREAFDLIVCDPPPSSTSSRAARFEIQKDHEGLLLQLADWLAGDGAILFSANLGGFTLSPRVRERFPARELTPGSLPEDFRESSWGRPPHRAWLLGNPWLAGKR